MMFHALLRKVSQGAKPALLLSVAVLLTTLLSGMTSGQMIPLSEPWMPTPYNPETYQRFMESRKTPFKMTHVMGSDVGASSRSSSAQSSGITLLDGGLQPPSRRVMVIVNDTLYPDIETSLNTYVADLQAEHYEALVYRCTGGTAEDLRAFIKSEYDSNGLGACVFVGALPYALYEDAYQSGGIQYEAFPCDMFFMDLDAEWLDTNPGSILGAQTGVYDGYVNGPNPGPEIVVGRIDASPLIATWPLPDEAAMTNSYFDKAHAWYNGTMPRTKRVLVYHQTYNPLESAYPNADIYLAGTEEDFRERVSRDMATDPTAYEYIEINSHGNPWSAQIGVGGWYDLDKVRTWPARPQFIHLRHCKTAQWTVRGGCLGSSYIFNGTSTTLVAIGSAKTTYGSSMIPWNYDEYLAQHATIGEAFRRGLVDLAPYSDLDVFTLIGLVILGDPMIRPLPPPIHVKPDGDDANDGYTWDTAKRTIGGAIAGIPANGLDAEIRVAAGTYSERLNFTKAIRLYGGFDGTEGSVSERDIQQNPTIIDGQGGDVITITNRQYATNRVDGFTITSGYSGRGIVCTSSPLAVENVTFTGNSGANGGGLYCTSSQLTVKNCSFVGNNATVNGGGVYASQCTGSISGCTLSENTAGTLGGGLYLSSSEIAVTDCTFSTNSAQSGGGVLCQGQPAPTFVGCTFTGNTATATYGYGGAIDCEQSPAVITQCTFTGNTSLFYGGAVSCSQSSAAISQCVFTGNTGRNYGGAVHFYDSSATITQSTLSGNSCQVYAGGAISARQGSPVISRNIITDNSAGTRGGGIDLLSAGGTIENNLITGGAATYGGGIYMSNGSYPNIVNNTIVDNSTPMYYGGGIRADGSTPTIKNNIIAWNSQGISVYGGSQVTLSHNNCYYNFYGGYNGLSPDADSICVDPRFVNRASGDYHPASDSPCVDAGTNTGAPAVDLDGRARPFGGSCDIGAYELCRILVKADSPGPVFDGLTWKTAFHTIGQAMSIARAKDEIWVAGGTYDEAVTMVNGVRLLGGFSGSERAPVERDPSSFVSTITGGGSEHAVTFDDISDASTTIDGFKISNSSADGVGIYCYGSGGVIERNIISGNDGGGIRIFEVDDCSLLTIARNTIEGNNSDQYGGGVFLDTSWCAVSYSNVAVVGNVFRGNTALYGAAICALDCDSGTKITNNTIVDNTATNSGGGIFMKNACPTIENNIIAYNSVYGISSFPGTCNPMVLPLRNNNVYGNSPANYYKVDPGPTDISLDPLLSDWSNGDLHIISGSPCINAGCDDANGRLEVDIDGEPRIIGITDIGADEYSIIHVSPTGDDANDGYSWANAKRTVQGAINATLGRAEIWVKAGTYAEQISLKSGNQLYGGFAGDETKREQRDWVTNLTTLDGGNADCTVRMSLLPDPLTTVDGFTIRSSPASVCKGIYCNAAYARIVNDTIIGNKGGGIVCENDSIATIAGNTISGNIGDYGGGVQVDLSIANIIGNTLTDNYAAPADFWGAGAISSCRSKLLISGNTISGNSGDWCTGGVSVFDTQLTLTDNTVTGNVGGWAGGLLLVASTGGYVSGNTITGNTGDTCGGILFSSLWDTTIANNLVADNAGAGIYGEDQGNPLVTNNTIVDNTGGVYVVGGAPTVQNNIVAFNEGYGVYCDREISSAPVLNNNDFFANSLGNYMNTSPGAGDISKNPFFVKRNAGDYRLKGKSPCIDAGTNTLAPAVDLDGMPRPIDGDGNGSAVCDMGAYERPTDLTYALSRYPNGTHIDIRPVSVTAVFAEADPSGENWVYVEKTDRSAGIRVKTDKTFDIGELLSVSGTIETDTSTGERYIDADADSPEEDGGTFEIEAIGMRNQWLGGGATGYERLIKNGFGFYNVGMLVQTWGRVKYVNAGAGYFYIDDGSDLQDTSGHRGVRVVVPEGANLPEVDDFVKVQGISGVMSLNGYYVRIVRVRSQSDITTVTSWRNTRIDLMRNATNSIALPGIPEYPAPELTFVAGDEEPPLLLQGYLRRYDSFYQAWVYFGGGCGEFGNCLFGDGYLLHVPQEGSPEWMTCRNTPAEGDQALSLPVGSEAPVYFAVVGNPFDVPIPWASCTVTDGVWTGTLVEAIEAGMIRGVYSWNGSDWSQVTDLSSGNMAPRIAYQIYPKYGKLVLVVPAP